MFRDFIPFMGSMIIITTYLPITIAGIISHIKQKKLTVGVFFCLVIHIVGLYVWHEIAVCLQKTIIAFGIISPILIFFISLFFLKKANFNKKEFKGWCIYKPVLKIVLYYVIISPMIAVSLLINLISVDCGI